MIKGIDMLKNEQAVTVHGVNARAFAVVAWPEGNQHWNGKIANQRISARRVYSENGRQYSITVVMRFDDKYKNGHEDFAITADIREDGREYMGGCCHDEIAKHFPEFAHLIRWHLVGVDGPMHYIANTTYHADEHGPTHAWVYYQGRSASDPLKLGDDSVKEMILGYLKAFDARKAEGQPGYRVQWDEKTAKVAHLEHARSTAVWPDATLEQLRDKAALAARLPALLEEFKRDMLAVGFIYPGV